MSDLHIVRYTTQSGDRYLQTGPMSWHNAITRWEALDDARRAGQLPWVRFFEVRDVDDPTNPHELVHTRVINDKYDYPDFLRRLTSRLDRPKADRHYTWQCTHCGRAILASGVGIGSHRRSTKCAEIATRQYREAAAR